MKYKLFLGINTILIILCVLLLGNNVNEVTTYSNYYQTINYTQMKEIIETENKVFIFFYEVSCLPCSSLKEKLNKILKTTKDNNVYAIDIEKNDFLSNSNIEIQSTPTIICYKNREEIRRIEENISMEKLKYFLR